MSNSQNKKNEQQNNLCTTLTEQWKKGELESGWYYVKGADGLIGMMSDYALYRVNLEHPDNEITLLAKMPSYEEWKQLHKFLEEFNALDVAKENQQLKELLLDSRSGVRTLIAVIDHINAEIKDKGANRISLRLKKLIKKIDNAIGEKK